MSLGGTELKNMKTRIMPNSIVQGHRSKMESGMAKNLGLALGRFCDQN